MQAGVCSLKIEGRLKSAHYVAATTQAYRAALDSALAGEKFELSRQAELDLTQSFSRGFTPGFLDGVDHQRLVQGRFPKARGVKVGTLVGKTARSVIVELDAEHAAEVLKPGDGVAFDEGHPDQDEQGGRVFEVYRLTETNPPAEQKAADSIRLEIVFGHGSVQLAALTVGSLVWRTDDPAMRKRLERSFALDRPVRRVTVHFHVSGKAGEVLRISVRDGEGQEATVLGAAPLELARKHPLSLEVLREQFGRLGETPFELGEIETDLPDAVMVPKSVLNELRRQAIDGLQQARAASFRRAIHVGALEELRGEIVAREDREAISRRSEEDKGAAAPQLYVLARTMEQLDAVLAWQPESHLSRPAMVYCDFEDVRRYRDAVARARAAGMPIGLASMRIIKPGEEGLLRQIAKHEPDAVLIRHLAALCYFREWLDTTSPRPELTLLGDFSLNASNELTAGLLAEQGAQAVGCRD